ALAEEPLLEGVRDEDVLDARVAIGDEPLDQLPVPRVVEAEHGVGAAPLAIAIEFREGPGLEGPTGGVGHVERDVDVAPVLVAMVAGDAPAALLRELADREPRARDARGHAMRRAVEELDELPGAVEAAVARVLGRVSHEGRLAEEDAVLEAAVEGVADGAALPAELGHAGPSVAA